jgi:hypothetical protein
MKSLRRLGPRQAKMATNSKPTGRHKIGSTDFFVEPWQINFVGALHFMTTRSYM